MTDVLIPYSFVPGTKAMASEVNANFIALAQGVEDCKTFTNQSMEDFDEQVSKRLDDTLLGLLPLLYHTQTAESRR